MEIALSCCAFMTLRSPCHVAQFLNGGGIEKLMTTISNHMDCVPVLVSLQKVSEISIVMLLLAQ